MIIEFKFKTSIIIVEYSDEVYFKTTIQQIIHDYS